MAVGIVTADAAEVRALVPTNEIFREITRGGLAGLIARRLDAELRLWTLEAEERLDGVAEISLLAERAAVGHLQSRARGLSPVVAEAAASADPDIVDCHPGSAGTDFGASQRILPWSGRIGRPSITLHDRG